MLLKAGRKGRSCTLRGEDISPRKLFPCVVAVFPAVKPSFRFAILKGQKEEKTSMSATGKPLNLCFYYSTLYRPPNGLFYPKISFKSLAML